MVCVCMWAGSSAQAMALPAGCMEHCYVELNEVAQRYEGSCITYSFSQQWQAEATVKTSFPDKINWSPLPLHYSWCETLYDSKNMLKNPPKKLEEQYVSTCYILSAPSNTCCLLSNGRCSLFGPGTPKWMRNVMKYHIAVSQLDFQQQLKKKLKPRRPWKNDTYRPQTVTFSFSSRMVITLGIFTVTSNFGNTAAEPKENSLRSGE